MQSSKLGLVKYILGSDAIPFIEHELSRADTFSKRILDLVQLSAGETWTYLPSGLRGDQFDRFDKSLPQEIEQNYNLRITPFLIEILDEYLGEVPNSYFVIGTLQKPDSPSLKSHGCDYFISGPEVYYFLTKESVSSTSIQEVFKWSRHYPLVSGLTKLQSDQDTIEMGKEISELTLIDLSRNLDYLFVGAYDAVGLLFWGRLG